jgi:hypothetical protein
MTFDISGVNLPLPAADMTQPTFAAKSIIMRVRMVNGAVSNMEVVLNLLNEM